MVHNLLVAFARHRNLAAGTGVLDLARFYEHVSHAELKEQAEATGFNLRLLQCLCVTYRLDRRASWAGSVSDAFQANGTITAGCSCAVGVAKLLLHALLVRIERQYPVVRAQNLVDDVLLQAVGGATQVAQQLPKAMNDLISELESKGLVISWKKTGYMANSTALADQLDQRWAMDASKRRTGARCLGGDGTDGRWRRVAEQDKRLQKAALVAAKVQQLRRAGAQVCHIQRGSPTATAVWSSAVTGLSDVKLHGLRVAALRAEGRMSTGSSVGLR